VKFAIFSTTVSFRKVPRLVVSINNSTLSDIVIALKSKNVISMSSLKVNEMNSSLFRMLVCSVFQIECCCSFRNDHLKMHLLNLSLIPVKISFRQM